MTRQAARPGIRGTFYLCSVLVCRCAFMYSTLEPLPYQVQLSTLPACGAVSIIVFQLPSMHCAAERRAQSPLHSRLLVTASIIVLCGADPSQPALTDDSARTWRLFAARGPRWAAQARHGATLGITAPVPRPRSRPARPWTGRARPPGGGPSRCCRTSAHAVSQCSAASAVTGT